MLLCCFHEKSEKLQIIGNITKGGPPNAKQASPQLMKLEIFYRIFIFSFPKLIKALQILSERAIIRGQFEKIKLRCWLNSNTQLPLGILEPTFIILLLCFRYRIIHTFSILSFVYSTFVDFTIEVLLTSLFSVYHMAQSA